MPSKRRIAIRRDRRKARQSKWRRLPNPGNKRRTHHTYGDPSLTPNRVLNIKREEK